MHLDEKKSNQKKKFSSKSNFLFLGTFNYTYWNGGRNATGHGMIQRERNTKRNKFDITLSHLRFRFWQKRLRLNKRLNKYI